MVGDLSLPGVELFHRQALEPSGELYVVDRFVIEGGIDNRTGDAASAGDNLPAVVLAPCFREGGVRIHFEYLFPLTSIDAGRDA
jgi:hypothetical protein